MPYDGLDPSDISQKVLEDAENFILQSEVYLEGDHEKKNEIEEVIKKLGEKKKQDNKMKNQERKKWRR